MTSMEKVAYTESEQVWLAPGTTEDDTPRWEIRGGGGEWDSSVIAPHPYPSRVIEMFADAGFELTDYGKEILSGSEDR